MPSLSKTAVLKSSKSRKVYNIIIIYFELFGSVRPSKNLNLRSDVLYDPNVHCYRETVGGIRLHKATADEIWACDPLLLTGFYCQHKVD